MDDKWFKKRQKEVGVTAEEIAREAGRTRSNVSHILNGHQKMSLDWARAFAKVLDVPLDEVMRRAGISGPEEAQRIAPGFAESDAAPFVGQGGDQYKTKEVAACFGGDRPGMDIWHVTSDAMSLRGYWPGDRLLVDMRASESCRAGDVVIAQVYNRQRAAAETVLRLFEPPVLVAACARQGEALTRVVDNDNVVIKGKVIASWRATD